MSLAFDGPFLVDRSGPPGTVRLRGTGVEILLEGVATDPLPAMLANVSVEEEIAGSSRQLALRAGSDMYRISARHWRVHEAKPDLYAGTLARFAPSVAERWAARLLLATAALPGAAALYRLWHAWRSR